MTSKQIENLSEKQFDESWQPAIALFWKRFNTRYFDQIDVLLTNSKTKSTCGFLVTSIDCVLIETIEQFYLGEDETKSIDTSYFNFFSRANSLNGIFETTKDAGKFAGLIRSGLLHQAKTKKSSIINIKKETPIIGWIDIDNKNLGFKINRNLFHKCVKQEYSNYVEQLKQPENSDLRNKFKTKMLSII